MDFGLNGVPMKSLEFYKTHLKLAVMGNLHAVRLKAKGWKFAVSKGDRGYCRYRTKTITIPRHALNRGGDYLTYYLCHEIAHALLEHRMCVPKYMRIEPHGIEFMEQLKAICPPHCLHYETGYKPRYAAMAGISSVPIPKEETDTDIDDDTDYCENLFDL